MKKYVAVILIITMLCFVGCTGRTDMQCAYFYEINSLIKDEVFFTANVEEGKIMLYDEEQIMIGEIEFVGYQSGTDLLCIRKDGPVVFFVTGGAVDDETGILFINDDSNNLLDGLKTIERIGGNSYIYDTAG